MNAVHLDKAVARRILAGDEEAFRSLFDRFFPRLYRFAVVRLNNDREAAREVVQETFCKGFERLDSYRGQAALYTWFCQICRNALVDYCRARSREIQHVTLLEDQHAVRSILEGLTAPALDNPDTGAWQRDIRRLVQATLDHLPAHYGDVLEWKYVDGLQVNEIAERLQLGPKAAESLLTRARSAFRTAMSAMEGSADVLTRPAG